MKHTYWIAFTIAFIIGALSGCSDPISSSSSQHPTMMAAADPVLASATGAGQTIVVGTLRTFSFTAREQPDGSVRGMAQVNNRLVQEMFQVDIDCLEVFDNLAVMSGLITRHTDTTAIGLPGIFAVRDVGEGGGSPPDSITQVFFFPRNSGVTCRDVTPTTRAHRHWTYLSHTWRSKCSTTRATSSSTRSPSRWRRRSRSSSHDSSLGPERLFDRADGGPGLPGLRP